MLSRTRELLFGDIPRADRLRYRLPVAIALGGAATLAALTGAHEVYQAAETDKGCATTEVGAGGDMTTAALAARRPLHLSQEDVQLQAALTYAAQFGSDGPVQSGDPVRTCITFNPLRFGNQWEASVQQVPERGS